MIIQCQSCSAKYFLPEEKVPVNPLKVRCPKCRAVFMLAAKKERGASTGAPSAAVSSAPVEAARARPSIADALRAVPMNAPPAPEAPAPVAVAVDEPAMEASHSPAPVEAPAEAPSAQASRTARGGKSADDRARRLARVLVSDILWYNRERRDAALRDGTLMTSLSEEIKKSWELYKEKVGPEAAHSTNYFKEALNEILANGQQVF